MESNYPDVQTPQPITAHNYKVVKVIKERGLANRGNKQGFQTVGACVQSSRTQKARFGARWQPTQGLPMLPCSPPAPKRKGGREREKHFFQTRTWKTERTGRPSSQEEWALEKQPRDLFGSCKDSASPLRAARRLPVAFSSGSQYVPGLLHFYALHFPAP